MGLQNIITSINPETGAKTINEKLIPGNGQPIIVCPHAVGGRNWIPGAYNPDTKILYVSAVETCMNRQAVCRGCRWLWWCAAIDVCRINPRDFAAGRPQFCNLGFRTAVMFQNEETN